MVGRQVVADVAEREVQWQRQKPWQTIADSVAEIETVADREIVALPCWHLGS